MAPADKARKRNHHLVRRYGITLAEFDRLLALQDGRCGNPGCRTATPGGRYNQWQLDHDHATGDLRGILCSPCNLALGMLGDDPDRISGLRLYIERGGS